MLSRLLRGFARVAFLLIVLAAVGLAATVGVTLYHFSRDLPDHQQLANYVPATGTKVYGGDGKLIAEFETENRIPVTIDKVPRMVIQAFLAAEDRDFYSHKGIDPLAILRAAMADVLRFHRGQRPMGASTITQQVVRHFLLNRELSVSRKVKEALLAYRIEHTLSKDRILEIYLNEIYFGLGAYGIVAAADTYFQKPLDKLTVAETAFLAALPKAPNNYNPIRHAAAAKARRDWVIAGMAEMGWISAADAKSATAEPLAANLRPEPSREHVGYFTEEVRRELIARFGEKTVYEGGMTIRTSYVASYQQMAEAAFRKGLVEYDRRHGWRGPVARHGNAAAAQTALANTADPPGIGKWQLAAVTATDPNGATIVLKNGGSGRIPINEMRWARKPASDQRLGPAVRSTTDVVVPGDIVLVEQLAAAAPAAAPAAAGKGRQAPAPSVASYGLRQIPDVSGGLVVMDPKTGRIFAMVGGWSFYQSQFNRTTQAKRQPGSAFKPFVFLAALQNGFSPHSIVEDAPLEISQGAGQQPWRPVNYEGGFYGAMTLEEALIRSRNLVTARLATLVGLPTIAKVVQDFDIMDRMPLYYSMSLGSGETTLLRLTNAYAMLDNGSRWLLPSVIDVVQDRNGRIVYQKGVKGCAACFVAPGVSGGSDSGGGLFRAIGAVDPSASAVPNAAFAENATVYKPTKKEPLASPEATADLISILQGVVERGTATTVAAVGKPLAGKTGTTNDWQDAWFVGFSPDLVAGVYVGFDEPRTLGEGETGGHVAAPIFRDFMMAALKDKPAKPFPPPSSAGAMVVSAVANSLPASTTDPRAYPSRGPRTEWVSPQDPPPEPGATASTETPEPAPGARRGRQSDYAPSPPNWSEFAARPSPAPHPGAPNPSAPPPSASSETYYPPPAREYGPPRQRDYAGRSPTYPPPWGAQQYAPPGWSAYAAPPSAGYGYSYSAPQAPAYPAPGWGGYPGYGSPGRY